MATEKFPVRNRWTGDIQFTAEIETSEWMTPSVKLGLAVKWARKSGADLRGADLRGAVLSDADLSGADLRGAVLSDADLRDAVLSGAVLSDAVLRSFKADFFLTLHELPNEVPALIAAMKEGRIDGSTYEGECACLVGTIANAADVEYSDLPHGANRPAEQWFAMIKKGDKPGDDSGGGFASKVALDWAEEWLATYGAKVAA